MHDTHERVVITRNEEPAAVLIAPDDLAALEEETIELVIDPEAMSDFRIAQAEIDARTTVELTALRRR